MGKALRSLLLDATQKSGLDSPPLAIIKPYG